MQLVQQTRTVDPVMGDIFILIANEFDRISKIIDPAPIVPTKIRAIIYPPPKDVVTFVVTHNRTNVILNWDAPQIGFLLYEIRQGSLWSTATRLLITATQQAILDPILIGTTTYLIKAINGNGVYSVNALSASIVISGIQPFVVSASIIGSYVLLDWTDPVTDFNIDYYIVTKDAGIIATKVFNSFYAVQELTGGDYTYGVTAVDIAGNVSAEMTVLASVASPNDFDFINSIISTLNGTIVNGKLSRNKIYFNIDLITTYEDHFINNSWASPQEQVDDGYPYWIQPTELTGSYEEIFDFTAVFQNVTVNVSYLFQVITGLFTTGLEIRVSDDNITYSSPYTSPAFFVTSVRYVKVKVTTTSGDTKGIMTFSNLICTLNIRRENDGGTLDIFAVDQPPGTLISFNKSFVLVESITISALDSVQKTAVYDFAGGLNPTDFYGLAFDAAGAPVDATVSWAARGVL